MPRVHPLLLCLLPACAAPEVLEEEAAPGVPDAAAMTVAPTCARLSDTRELIPSDAMGMVGLDMARLRTTGVFSDIEAALRADPNGADALAVADKCGVGPSNWDGVTMATTDGGDIVVVLEAPGLGRGSTLDCLSAEIVAKTGTAPWTRKTASCGSDLSMAGGDFGWAIDDDRIAFATPGWGKTVAQRRVGRGKSARSGKLKWAFGSVDTSKPVWFAVDVPSVAKGATSGTPAEGIQRVGGAADLSKGLDVDVVAGFDRASAASAAASEINAQLSKAMLLAPMLGVPTGVLTGLSVRAKGNELRMSATISEADLNALRDLAKDTLGLGAGGAHPARPTPRPTPTPKRRKSPMSAI